MRQETWDKRQETRDMRQETRDKGQETWNKRKETRGQKMFRFILKKLTLLLRYILCGSFIII